MKRFLNLLSTRGFSHATSLYPLDTRDSCDLCFTNEKNKALKVKSPPLAAYVGFKTGWGVADVFPDTQLPPRLEVVFLPPKVKKGWKE